MKIICSKLIFALASLLLAVGVFAADSGTAAQATALVKKASAYLKENGQQKAFEAFNNPKGEFVDRDLYIFILDKNGRILAHGANAKLLGKDLLPVRDIEGHYFIKTILEVAKTKGTGWVDYKWPDPVSKAIRSKSTYLEKHDDLIVNCGIYK